MLAKTNKMSFVKCPYLCFSYGSILSIWTVSKMHSKYFHVSGVIINMQLTDFKVNWRGFWSGDTWKTVACAELEILCFKTVSLDDYLIYQRSLPTILNTATIALSLHGTIIKLKKHFGIFISKCSAKVLPSVLRTSKWPRKHFRNVLESGSFQATGF